MRKPNYKILSVILSLLMVFSVISFPKLTAKADGVDDFIGRCYQVTLGRDADADGYVYWRDILVNRKQDGSVVAHGFLFSPEYIDKNTTNEQYVKDLYMLFMGREPEQSGYDYWCEKMTNGEDREKIFAGFANSEEYFKLCNGYGITAGYYSADYDIQQINGVNLFVERMYQTSLDRLGDQGCQNDWVQDLLSGRISGIECARCFVQSPEFINKGLSNEAYLKSLYRAFMGREYDQNGLNYWLDKMDNGYTRDEVFAGFANSPEFEGICANYGIIRGDYTPTDIGNKNNPNNNDEPIEEENLIKIKDYFKNGKWILASQGVVDVGKAEGVGELIKYITLDDSYTNITFNVPENANLEYIKPSSGGNKGTIEIWSFTDEVPKVVYKIIQDHPDFDYNVNTTVKSLDAGYQNSLKQAMMNGMVDIYVCDSDFALEYLQGDMAKFAAPCESLGIDVNEVRKAGYSINKGTRPKDDKLIGIGNTISNSSEGIELKGEISKITNIDTSDGIVIEHGGGDSVIVGKYVSDDKFLYGAYSLDGKEIAPIQYEGYCQPNDYGYFVLMKDLDENGNYSQYDLFSSNGDIIYSGPYNVVASNEAYIIAKQNKNSNTRGGYDEDFKMEYYTYDNKLLVSVDCTSLDGLWMTPNGFIEGQSVVIKADVVRGEKYFYSKENYIWYGGFYNYLIGFVSPDGTVVWKDGDGVDVSDTSKYMTGQEMMEFSKNDSRLKGSSIPEGEWDLMRPMNAPVDGYMMGVFDNEPYSIKYYMRDSNGYTISVSPWGMILGDDGQMYMCLGNNVDENNELCETGYSSGAYTGMPGDIINRTQYFYHNGFNVANYGTTMLLRTDTKYILVDFPEELDASWHVFDSCSMSMEKYWLISLNGKWGYCNHDGEVIQLYDDATEFYNGYAVIIEDGKAYLIDEYLEKVSYICEADTSIQLGQVFFILNGDEQSFYSLK